jgi:twitching motility protein PilI
MVENEPSIATASRPWLTPTAALERFQPPHGLSVGAAPEEAAVRFGFRVGALGLLVAPSTVCEVIVQPVVYPVPNSPPWLAGLMNLRGNLVPVFDLHLAWELGEPQARSRHTLLVLDRGEAAAGLYIDELPHAVDTSHLLRQLPPMPVALREHVTNAYIENGIAWLEFLHQQFFLSLGARLGI